MNSLTNSPSPPTYLFTQTEDATSNGELLADGAHSYYKLVATACDDGDYAVLDTSDYDTHYDGVYTARDDGDYAEREDSDSAACDDGDYAARKDGDDDGYTAHYNRDDDDYATHHNHDVCEDSATLTAAMSHAMMMTMFQCMTATVLHEITQMTLYI
ncbi:hypothetical protein IW148_004262 [Coemansia sp. RSA 1199]|nr:hypothetical protein IW148_004262 [Coemansia sp. RSA 1199]